MFFDKPIIKEFFDNRIVISWEISQPKELPSLDNIKFTISGEPELIFEPSQSSIIEIPRLEDNNIILSWVVTKPQTKTDIYLHIKCQSIEETQKVLFIP